MIEVTPPSPVRAIEVTPAPTPDEGILAMVTLLWPVMTGLTCVPTAGLMRGAAVGLSVGTRESICRLGVRMMLCACATEPPRMANGNASADNAARCVFIRQFTLR